jgi:Domain of unknown function (DUF6285)
VSQDRPAAVELLRTVREFVDSVRPKLAGEDQYHAVVAAYVLGIVERELEMAPGFDQRERRELADFTGCAAPLAELPRMLCEGIRDGRYDDRFDELLALLLEHTANKVRIVRPDHLDPSHRRPPGG